MDERCNVCGHVGLINAMATCSKCLTAREHVYCMRIHCVVVPEIWICEACRQGSTMDQTEAKSLSKVCTVSGEKIHKGIKKSAPTATVRKTIPRLNNRNTATEVDGNRQTEKAPPSPKQGTPTAAVLGKSLFVKAGARNSVAEDRNTLSVRDKLKLFHQYTPALYATWTGGSFKLAHSGELYGGFEGIPPYRIRPSLNNLTKKLPNVLDVELHPRSYLPADFFDNGGPDLRDLCAYFFPVDDTERSKEKKDCLYELIETNKSVIRCLVDKFELIILTSDQLCEVSQCTLGMMRHKKFLWGVYRSRNI